MKGYFEMKKQGETLLFEVVCSINRSDEYYKKVNMIYRILHSVKSLCGLL